ncbi:hypothetical protein MKW92_008535 [Papaver armeniacum]|nr:hypothetical protein MKW92_008535 [Papaver armeniacum]
MTNSRYNEGEVGMDNSTAIEENKEDEALNYTILSDLGSRSVSHCVSPDRWLYWLRNDDEWVGKELDRRRRWTWINVYAYFDKEEGCGGYGVILRNALAKPLVASANFSKNGTSFYYQVFIGIKAGVKLAEKHELSEFHVECNSDSVPALFCDARRCSSNECRHTRDPYNICKSCEVYLLCYEGCDRRLVMPLVLELRAKTKIIELSNAWGSNAAAHYLAKREKQKNKRHQVTKKEERICPDDDDHGMEVDEFPQELRNIVWKDALGMHFRGIGPLAKKDFTM